MAKSKPSKPNKRQAKARSPKSSAKAKPEKRSRRSIWQVQEARAHLSALIEAAMAGRPQSITRAGKEAVVILAAGDYKALVKATQSVDELFLNSPLAAVFGPAGVPEYRHKEVLRTLML